MVSISRPGVSSPSESYSIASVAGREFNLPVLELHAGDLIAVSVYDAPELTRTVRVDPDGTIRLPLLTEGK